MSTALFKARLLAGVCLPWMTPQAVKQLVSDMTLAVYRTVQPGTFGATVIGCPCQSKRQLNGACDYHGNAARRIIANDR